MEDINNSPPPLWIGIGASAGGLESITALCQQLPSDANAIYIIAQHLSPIHNSMLSELIQRKSRLKVVSLRRSTLPQPNTIYVTPPQRDVIVRDGHLVLLKNSDNIGPKPSVNGLFASLAAEIKDRAIGVILSGTGSDGSLGVKAIHEAGGVTIAESEQSAKHTGMPNSARETRCIDFSLSASEIGAQIGAIVQQLEGGPSSAIADGEVDVWTKFFAVVYRETGTNLKEYKRATLQRRIARRMLATGLNTFTDYVNHLIEHAEEAKAILDEILISVTSFLRDRAPFDVMSDRLTAMLVKRPIDRPIRIWSAGCATGEEAYSMAMLLAEALGGPERLCDRNIKIFATDIDEAALTVARRGVYGETAVSELPETFLRKYFIRSTDNKFEVIKPLRELILFATHNLIQDPPFQRIDVLVCRNLMIYFEPQLQERIYKTFHYSLNEEGLLFLGKSESISTVSSLFSTIDSRFKIFEKRHALVPRLASPLLGKPVDKFRSTKTAKVVGEVDSFPYELLVKQMGEAAFLIDDSLQVERFFGNMTPFLAIANGRPSWYVPDLVPRECSQEIRALTYRALSANRVESGIVHLTLADGKERVTRLQAFPLIGAEGSGRSVLITFAAAATDIASDDDLSVNSALKDPQRIVALEAELATVREHLQTVIEELETTNEELQSTNEELQSSNEELQSSNEELETTNEELQSTNEELVTMNDELQAKTLELGKASTQLLNIKNSLEFPLIVLDFDHQVLRSNRKARSLFPLLIRDGLWEDGLGIPADSELAVAISQVMSSGQPMRPLITLSGLTYCVHITPFQNQQGEIDGVILSLIDMSDELRKAQELEESKRRAESATIAKAEFLASVSHEIRTPLNAIYGVGEILQRNLDKPDMRERLLNVLFNSSQTLKALLDDVLDFSRLEAGQVIIDEQPFAMRKLVEQLTTAHSLRSAEKDLSLEYAVTPNVPEFLIGDSHRISQILNNLLSNAVKFTAAGEVRVTVTGDRQGERFFTQITVADTGIGMDEVQQRKVFDKFSQASPDITRRYGGTGLGLAIVSELCKLMGGSISVRSTPGKGSIFRVELPLSCVTDQQVNREEADQLPPLFDSAAAAQQFPILVVEDHADNRMLMQMYLEALGCQAEFHATVDTALQALHARRFALIFLDLQVGERSGFDVMAEVHQLAEQNPERQRPVVLALTAHVHEASRERCREAGMDGFLSKPIDQATLRLALARYLHLKGCHDTIA